MQRTQFGIMWVIFGHLPGGTGSAWQQMATTATATDGSFVFPHVSGYLPDGPLAAGGWRLD
jgi:hypothetical protein